MHHPRVLFILKQRAHGAYGSWDYTTYGGLPSGLSVSAQQVAIALDELGIQNKIVQVVDNNCIDREVALYKPTHVIIEAFWVVPPKFDVLRKLHPTVKWIIRNHSKSDFLSQEGGAIGWAIDYISRGLTLACNSIEATEDFKRLAISVNADPKNVVYLPNYYDTPEPTESMLEIQLAKLSRHLSIFKHRIHLHGELDIGCFGAIRPMKNHMLQALAAIETAQNFNVKLRFWINANRIEGRAEPVLNSLRALFARYPQHELVEVGWQEHDKFIETVKTMTIVMQVSNSETFNIVAADAVAVGVPVLVSTEIPWLDHEFKVDSHSVTAIVKGLAHVIHFGGNGMLEQDQLEDLYEYTQESKRIWGEYLLHNKHHHFD